MEFANSSITWPEIDPVAKPYYDGMQHKKIMLQRCQQCHTWLAPAQMLCDECGSFELQWLESDGHGVIYTYATFHRSFHPAFTDMLPYTIALIELSEGPRVMARLVDFSDEQLVIGQAVSACFKSCDNEHLLLCFNPS